MTLTESGGVGTGRIESYHESLLGRMEDFQLWLKSMKLEFRRMPKIEKNVHNDKAIRVYSPFYLHHGFCRSFKTGRGEQRNEGGLHGAMAA